MLRAMIITSRHNPTIKAIAQFRKRKVRDEQKLMLIEGFEELSMAAKSRIAVRQIIFCPELMLSRDQLALLEAFVQAEQLEVSREVFEKIAYRESPDGWLAIAGAVDTSLTQLKLPKDRPAFVIICEAVEKPGNLGAILRTADAVGADAVIVADPITDWANPNIVRASKGALFTVPVASATSTEVMEWLREHSIAIMAATPEEGKTYTAIDMRSSVAIAVGTEKYGLSQTWLDKAQLRATIPMFGKIDSLNVATSAAILAYEVVRQRQNA